MNYLTDFDVIFTIVERGKGETIIKATHEAGAEGATLFFGRGTGIHEHRKILGIPIEPEKEIVITLIEKEKSDAILEAIVRAGKLDEPGRGRAFVISVDKMVGAFHLEQKGQAG
ncbi:MAG: P-II family nitrogen regulator [Candidatus Methanoperedens sp.]|uniref:P-II family nitrogen regulator n=1 Tax=Candidatus Methanoperedens sp. BLZ2 TaxID=2035255 RepID=UPI000BE2327C|nr:P-II family nitrogen regulator [Candidatus Methanoperedens sp. BLZ2]KAB2947993.1 MAG: P-II family nitrogen regulator [Candidatus Methanoperedens sp.]MBZ0176330.1 P-II family nitrogen regulator [Candidatus Methanoperedens nitroreducens]MCX9080171.1 P-II family nitrogen regulator [Candidatus Methanoperedens sp.]